MKKIITLLALLAASSQVTAVPINGEIGFIGFDYNFNSTEVTFNRNAIVAAATENLSGLVAQEFPLADIVFSPLSYPLDLWTSADGNFSYVLQSLSNTNYDPLENTVSVSGDGVLSGVGFDDTLYSFVLTGNNLTFSGGQVSGSIPTASTVSEPGILSLFAIGCVGLLRLNRKKQS